MQTKDIDMKMNYTNVNTYDYFLPEELIAQSPIEPRDASRLLVFNQQSKQIETYHSMKYYLAI